RRRSHRREAPGRRRTGRDPVLPFPVRRCTGELPWPLAMSALHAGSTIAGKYRLLSPLGRGSMGEVWKAENALLKNLLAIKVIHPQHLAGGETDPRALLERFFREARATSALRSPNVVQILDYGQDGAVPFMAMELLEGETLE